MLLHILYIHNQLPEIVFLIPSMRNNSFNSRYCDVLLDLKGSKKYFEVLKELNQVLHGMGKAINTNNNVLIDKNYYGYLQSLTNLQIGHRDG